MTWNDAIFMIQGLDVNQKYENGVFLVSQKANQQLECRKTQIYPSKEIFWRVEFGEYNFKAQYFLLDDWEVKL